MEKGDHAFSTPTLRIKKERERERERGEGGEGERERNNFPARQQKPKIKRT